MILTANFKKQTTFDSASGSQVRTHLDEKTFENISPRGDSRELVAVLSNVKRATVDAIITSPPYATALPHIDTSRLSLVLLGLCAASELKTLEKAQIANREISPYERKKVEQQISEKLGSLPSEVGSLYLMVGPSTIRGRSGNHDGSPLPDPASDNRNPHAVALGSMGGRKGGRAKAKKLSAAKA